MPKRNLITIGVADTASEAASLMRKEGISQLPVVDGKVLVGLLTEDGILQYLASGQQSRSTLVRQIMNRSVSTVEMSSPISTLNDELLKTGSVVVIDKDRQPVTILTKIDLVEYLIGQDSKEGAAV